jgi:hypothetical protein
MKHLKVGKFTYTPENWIFVDRREDLGYVTYILYCENEDNNHCDSRAIQIYKRDIEAFWGLNFEGFPREEYALTYGKEAKYKFDSFEEAKEHVNNFLAKLHSLHVFL